MNKTERDLIQDMMLEAYTYSHKLLSDKAKPKGVIDVNIDTNLEPIRLTIHINERIEGRRCWHDFAEDAGYYALTANMHYTPHKHNRYGYVTIEVNSAGINEPLYEERFNVTFNKSEGMLLYDPSHGTKEQLTIVSMSNLWDKVLSESVEDLILEIEDKRRMNNA